MEAREARFHFIGAILLALVHDRLQIFRARHDLPHDLRMYAFGAALGGHRVLAATRALARQSGIPRSHLVLIDRHRTYAHNDPNTASPGRDVFLKRLIPFLHGLTSG